MLPTVFGVHSHLFKKMVIHICSRGWSFTFVQEDGQGLNPCFQGDLLLPKSGRIGLDKYHRLKLYGLFQES